MSEVVKYAFGHYISDGIMSVLFLDFANLKKYMTKIRKIQRGELTLGNVDRVDIPFYQGE